MNIYLVETAYNNMPKTMIITITVSVLAVLALAGFVFYMWKSQEGVARTALAIQKITNTMGSGIVTFTAEDDGRIIYASDGFYELIGFSHEEVAERFARSIYLLIEPKYAEYLRLHVLTEEESISEEVRIQTKDGYKWVIIKGNYTHHKVKTVSAVIVDISKEKQLDEQLTIEQERYRLATELSNDVILNYDIDTDVLKLSENFKQFYGGAVSYRGFLREETYKDGIVHEEDIEKAAEILRILMNMGGNVDQQIRVRDNSGKYVWCRLIAMPVKDQGGVCRALIGKLINIDMHKRELGRLENEAMRDALTGAFNKGYSKMMIDRYILEHQGVPGMLLLVDIDKFKHINDTFGHLAGDEVIKAVVNQVKAAFRVDDIVGRIGGDEFVVFVCNVRSREHQLKQAQKLHEVLRQPAVFPKSLIDKSAPADIMISIEKSASVGVAMYPEHGTSYDELIANADTALYDVKGSGRDSFKIVGE